ncbi:cAMP-regulated phosphoprotein 19 isoform X2 [Halyomorpha halys]|uniref:cAMP-regulated phosphoprotein 19 isoform X2 n=1 Tax=Halyomorpha halys TaxID=286706 RepID=UPI0034D28FE0
MDGEKSNSITLDDVKSDSNETTKPDNGSCNLDNAAWLKSKYPMGLSGHSAFLQKKLAKGQKYFDSGDYQMARQTTGVTKGRQSQTSTPFFNFPTGEAIPTPESVPVRKTSIIQPKFHVPPPPTSPPMACNSNVNTASTNYPSNS